MVLHFATIVFPTLLPKKKVLRRGGKNDQTYKINIKRGLNLSKKKVLTKTLKDILI